MSGACCALPAKNRRRARRLIGVGGSAGPGVVLLLLPKCPACVAAYLAVFTGAGLAGPVAEHLRPVIAAIFGVSVAYLVMDRVVLRRRAVC